MKKIYFCVSQVKITQNLLSIIESNFFARVISRNIIIRVYDFINLTRQYNNKHITDNILKQSLKEKLNNLSDEFDAKLKIQRHKFSAHFQDLEFSQRVDSWSSISKNEIDDFYTKIIEIYNLLGNQNDYQEILENNFELLQQEVINIQNIVREKDIESTPHFSNDILSITRANTGATIPCHPIQDKVLSLNSIHLMINFEISFYKVLETNTYKELIKMILINDIISFIDNFITRENSNYIALDNIIDIQLHPWKKFKYIQEKPNNFNILKQSKYDLKKDIELKNAQDTLNNFLSKFKLDSLNSIRDIRNKLGSHIDDKDSLADLFHSFDDLKVDFLLKIYSNFYHLFSKICNTVFYLKHFIMPPTKMNGITAIFPQPTNMFFDNVNIQTDFDREDINDTGLYDLKLKNLLNYNQNFEDSEYYFREALFNSDVNKSVVFEGKNIEINNCHTYFLNKLNNEIDIDEKRLILILLKNSSGWSSRQITYILTETYELNQINLNYEYLVYFGDTTKENSTTVMNILLNNLRNTNDFNTMYYVISSMLKMDVNIWGSVLVNNRQQAKESQYSENIKQTIENLNPLFKVIVTVLLKSEMVFTNHFSLYRNFYKDLYIDCFQKVFVKNIKLLKPNMFLKKRLEKEDINALKLAFEHNKFTLIFIKLAEKSNSENAKFLYSIIVNLLKLNFQYLPFIEHYAYAKHKLGNIDEAVEIYRDLVYKNPDEVEYRIELLSYYLEQKNTVAIINEIEYIEGIFNIDEKQQEKINNIKQIIEDQQKVAQSR